MVDSERLSDLVLLRLPQVLELIPVSRSTWWAGVKSGRFPPALKLGPRTTAWRAADIRALVERLSAEPRTVGARKYNRPQY